MPEHTQPLSAEQIELLRNPNGPENGQNILADLGLLSQKLTPEEVDPWKWVRTEAGNLLLATLDNQSQAPVSREGDGLRELVERFWEAGYWNGHAFVVRDQGVVDELALALDEDADKDSTPSATPLRQGRFAADSGGLVAIPGAEWSNERWAEAVIDRVLAGDDHQTCPECKGSGERPCVLCKNTGRLVMHERYEAGGGGSNVERDCPNCATEGTGEGQ